MIFFIRPGSNLLGLIFCGECPHSAISTARRARRPSDRIQLRHRAVFVLFPGSPIPGAIMGRFLDVPLPERRVQPNRPKDGRFCAHPIKCRQDASRSVVSNAVCPRVNQHIYPQLKTCSAMTATPHRVRPGVNPAQWKRRPGARQDRFSMFRFSSSSAARQRPSCADSTPTLASRSFPDLP